MTERTIIFHGFTYLDGDEPSRECRTTMLYIRLDDGDLRQAVTRGVMRLGRHLADRTENGLFIEQILAGIEGRSAVGLEVPGD